MPHSRINKAFFSKTSLQSLAGLILLGLLMVAIQGCSESKPTTEEAELAELEVYLDRLEQKLEEASVESWKEIEAEYKLRRERLLETTEVLSESVNNRLAELDKRFENAEVIWQQTQPVAKGDNK